MCSESKCSESSRISSSSLSRIVSLVLCRLSDGRAVRSVDVLDVDAREADEGMLMLGRVDSEDLGREPVCADPSSSGAGAVCGSGEVYIARHYTDAGERHAAYI